MSNIRYECIPVGKLISVAQEFKDTPGIVPISESRARAQAANPVSVHDDVGLVLALDGGRCAGFLGLVPFRFWNGNHITRVHAASTILVDPDYRGLGLAKGMMARAIDLQLDLVLTGFTPEAERFYSSKREWFERAPSLQFRRVHLFPPSSAVYAIGKRPWMPSWLKSSIRATSDMFGALGGRPLTGLLLGLFNKDQLADYLVSEVPSIELKGRHIPDHLPPGRATFVYEDDSLNWMISYPWIEESSDDYSRYEFSHIRDLFRYKVLELTNRRSGDRVGLVVVLTTNKKGVRLMRVLQSISFSSGFSELLPWVVLHTAYENRIDVIQCDGFMDQLSGHNGCLRAATQKLEQGYFIHRSSRGNVFPDDPSMIDWSYYDGDIAFT